MLNVQGQAKESLQNKPFKQGVLVTRRFSKAIYSLVAQHVKSGYLYSRNLDHILHQTQIQKSFILKNA